MTDVGLSDTDLSRPGILEDCRHALMRCERGEASYLMWAIRWGRALVHAVENPNIADSDDYATLERELNEVEAQGAEYRDALQSAFDIVEDLDPKDEDLGAKLDKLFKLLDGALA